MDIRNSQAYHAFVYEPALYGFNTAYWKELNGSASTISNKIRLNSVAIVSKHQYLRGKFTFSLTMTSNPGAGQNKEFGLKSPAIGTARNAAYFQILGGTVNLITSGPTGTVTTTPIDASNISGTTWTSATEFTIFWERNKVEFQINGIPVGSMTDRNFVPQSMTIPVYIANYAPNDNLDMNYLDIEFVDQVVMPNWELPIVSPAASTDLAVESAGDTVTVSESVTTKVSPPVVVSDAITVSESVSVYQHYGVSVNEAITVTESKTVSAPA